jgi:DNA-3-methyladenine glycosylase II
VIRSTGSVEEPELRVELKTVEELSPSDVRKARAMVNSMFNLDMDLKPFYKAVKGDPVLSGLARKMYGLKSPTTPTVFEALVDSIIEQQISLIAAHAMQSRMIKEFGDPLTIEGTTYYMFPTPEKLSAARIEELKSCGLSTRKAEYIKDVAMLVASGSLDLDKFEGYDDIEAIREELSSIRGIGRWTAEMTMIRGLHKMDSIPADDIGLQAKISYFYGREHRVSSDELREIAERWGKYRGLGGYYLIMTLDLERGEGVGDDRAARARTPKKPAARPPRERIIMD